MQTLLIVKILFYSLKGSFFNKKQMFFSFIRDGGVERKPGYLSEAWGYSTDTPMLKNI